MAIKNKKEFRRFRIKKRIRKVIHGTPDRPRMTVFRSNKEIYVQLIDDLASLATDKKLKMTKLDLNELVENSAKLFKVYADNNKIKMNVEQGEIKEICGDWQKLMQVMTNLILNAFAAMPEGGQLIIKTHMNEDKVVLEVSDTGHGIPKEQINEVFEPFFTTKKNGTGLGLAISYKILKVHGANIAVESIECKGTRFIIVFDLA